MVNKEKPGEVIQNRFSPKELIVEWVKKYKIRHHYLDGNHDPLESDFGQFLLQMEGEYDNFSASSYLEIGNCLFFHGHQFVQYVPYHQGLKTFYSVAPTEKHSYLGVAPEESARLANALCQVDLVREFIENKGISVAAQNNGKVKLHIFFGHTHKYFDQCVRINEDVEVQVTNLGALLPGRKQNFKIISLDRAGAVIGVDGLSLSNAK